jgi:hypothetical protein
MAGETTGLHFVKDSLNFIYRCNFKNEIPPNPPFLKGGLKVFVFLILILSYSFYLIENIPGKTENLTF